MSVELLREKCGPEECVNLMRAFRSAPEYALYEADELAGAILKWLDAPRPTKASTRPRQGRLRPA
jgi:hypothetical protein